MLYIRLKNGQPFEHPIIQHNLLLMFPTIDLQALPEYVAIFVAAEKPAVGVYEVAENAYVMDNNIVRETWTVRSMNEQEKTEKQQSVKTLWNTRYPNSTWIFNEETCVFDPPVIYPTDGKTYEWSDDINNWIEIIPD